MIDAGYEEVLTVSGSKSRMIQSPDSIRVNHKFIMDYVEEYVCHLFRLALLKALVHISHFTRRQLLPGLQINKQVFAV